MSEHRHLIVGYVEEAEIGRGGTMDLHREPNPSRRPVVLWDRVRPVVEAADLAADLLACEVTGKTYRCVTGTLPEDRCEVCKVRDRITAGIEKIRQAQTNLYDTPGDG